MCQIIYYRVMSKRAENQINSLDLFCVVASSWGIHNTDLTARRWGLSVCVSVGVVNDNVRYKKHPTKRH